MKKSILLVNFFLCIVLIFTVTSCGSGGGGGVGGRKGAGTNYNINGAVQKGPFVLGTTITIQELDQNLAPTGKTYSTETVDDLGKFTLQSIFTSPYVEITASGYYFDEVVGLLSTAPLTLRAIACLSDSTNVNVNILTTLEKKRLVYLVQSGKTFSEAKIQSEGEVLNIFASSAESGGLLKG